MTYKELKSDFDSPFLLEELNKLSDEHQEQYVNGIKFLQQTGAQFVLIGSCALQHYITSARQLTPDMDFIVSDLSTVKTEAKKNGFEVLPLKNALSNVIKRGSDFGYQIVPFNMDVLSSGTLFGKYVLKYNSPYRIFGMDISVVDVELLYIMKSVLSRDKDISDSILMLRAHSINGEKLIGLINELRKNGDIDEQTTDDLLLYASNLDKF